MVKLEVVVVSGSTTRVEDVVGPLDVVVNEVVVVVTAAKVVELKVWFQSSQSPQVPLPWVPL